MRVACFCFFLPDDNGTRSASFSLSEFFLAIIACSTRHYHTTIIWPHNVIIFSQVLLVYHQKRRTNGACPSSYAKKTPARQVIPLAPGYRTALLLCPDIRTCFEQTPCTKWTPGVVSPQGVAKYRFHCYAVSLVVCELAVNLLWGKERRKKSQARPFHTTPPLSVVLV